MRRAALALALTVAAALPAEERRTGYEEMSPALQAMQDDPFANPGLLWVQQGEARFAADCTGCHAAEDMAGVAARHPAWDDAAGGPLDLTGRITLCRARGGAAPPRDDPATLALAAYLTHLSRGMPIAPPDPRLRPWEERGAALWEMRMGQLNLACAQCHDDNAGGRLLAARIPQAHPTGYPQYRLEWETMGPLSRRFDNCMTGVRAEPFGDGSPEYLALEIYLRARAAGLPIESPAVRP